jgi:hypothetical protein
LSFDSCKKIKFDAKNKVFVRHVLSFFFTKLYERTWTIEMYMQKKLNFFDN